MESLTEYLINNIKPIFEKDEAWYSMLPDANLDICKKNLKLFFDIMYERQMIWKRRFIDKKEQPWTDNKYFQNIKFTNVYRELDRSCPWEIKNIICDDKLSLKDLIWKMMVYRYFNKPETFIFGEKYWRNGIPSWDEYNKKTFAKFIDEFRNEFNDTPFTAAYTIYNADGMTRDEFYLNNVIPFTHKHIDELINIVKNANAPEDIINFLKTFPAMSNFLSHEVYQDFTYIAKYTNHEFMKFGLNDFTNVGPGSKIGLRLIYPNISKVDQQKEHFGILKDLAGEYLADISKTKGENFPYLYWDKNKKQYYVGDECNITLNQIEMWLCEFFKYWKITTCNMPYRKAFVPKTKELIVGCNKK